MKYNCILLLVAVFLFSGCLSPFQAVEIQVETIAGSPPVGQGEGVWIYSNQYSDEFESAELDETKWYDHNPTWEGRNPGYFYPKNINIQNGMLILKSKKEDVDEMPEGYHTWTTAAVQSTKKVLYGFFEARCRPMDSGISSAFWLYMNNEEKQEELDIFEICGRNDNRLHYERSYISTSHYVFDKRTKKYSSSTITYSDENLAGQTLVAGLDWSQDYITWYINGIKVKRIKNRHWHTPETINFDSEYFESWWGAPAEDDVGGQFEIDYFRYWTRS